MNQIKLKEILSKQQKDFELLFNSHNEMLEGCFNQLFDELTVLKKTIEDKDLEIGKLNSNLKDNSFNQSNYQNFSIVSNLSKQISEKELEIKTYQSQLRIAKKEIESLKEKIELISEKDEYEDNHKDPSLDLQIIYPTIEETQDDIPDDTTEEDETEAQDNTKEEIEAQVQDDIPEDTKDETQVQDDSKDETETQAQDDIKEETQVQDDTTEEEEEEEEEEISYIRKKIKGKYYYVSDEEPNQIYECLEGNEVGEVPLGKMNGIKAEFY